MRRRPGMRGPQTRAMSSQYLKPNVPHPNGVPSIPNQARAHFANQNQAPMAWFFFLAPTSLLLCLTQLHPPCTSTLVYPAPMGSPLPQIKPVHILLAKTEPPQLSFWFLAQTSLPSRLTQSHPLTTSIPVCPTPIESPLPDLWEPR